MQKFINIYLLYEISMKTFHLKTISHVLWKFWWISVIKNFFRPHYHTERHKFNSAFRRNDWWYHVSGIHYAYPGAETLVTMSRYVTRCLCLWPSFCLFMIARIKRGVLKLMCSFDKLLIYTRSSTPNFILPFDWWQVYFNPLLRNTNRLFNM
jgi:hypothetical protein